MPIDHDIVINDQARSGTLIFFHGYGANAQEMADHVGVSLSDNLSHVKLRFPNGIEPTHYNPNQRSWYDIQDMLYDKDVYQKPFDGNLAAPRALSTMTDIHAYIDRVLEDDDINPDQLILAGFSQGATLAFYAALQRHEEIAGVVSISGPAIDQVQGIHSSPPILLMAGAEEFSHFSGRELASKTHDLLLKNGFMSDLFLTPDNGHNICQNSLNALASFTRNALNGNAVDPTLRAAPQPF